MKKRKRTNVSEKEIKEVLNESIEEQKKEREITQVISTGSTLLDLSISGGVIHGGGVPGGIVMEIFGPSSSGKTALLAELAGSCQKEGGEVRFDDPEARLDAEYSRIYGLELDKANYYTPDTVNEMFDGLWNWQPKDNSLINISCADSLAALSTEMEMQEEDKMGMKRAKDFSAGLRKTCRMIKKNNWLIACSNQEKHGGTPGGKAFPYHSSLRLRIAHLFKGSKIEKTKTINGSKFKKTIGVRSGCSVKKNSIDQPFRECNVSIIFGYGIDDIRENLMYNKLCKGDKKFHMGGEEWAKIDKAISVVEEKDLEQEIKEETITLWHEMQEKFKVIRKRKKR
jgi:recombination protein RecA